MVVKVSRTRRERTLRAAYVVLGWFVLVLAASLLGIFAQYPPLFYVTVGGPVVVFVAAYLLLGAFRAFVHDLVGDPWGITALQIYRVFGAAMAVEATRNALPAVFGLPAGLGDFFIGMTALLAALGWVSGGRRGRAVFVLWNILGLLDLVMALGTGALALFAQSSPVTMAPMRDYPLTLVPAFGVPLAFILHLTGLAQARYLARKPATLGRDAPQPAAPTLAGAR